MSGITANREHLRSGVEHSIGIVTALNPYIGYAQRHRDRAGGARDGRSVYELVLEKKLLTQGAARRDPAARRADPAADVREEAELTALLYRASYRENAHTSPGSALPPLAPPGQRDQEQQRRERQQAGEHRRQLDAARDVGLAVLEAEPAGAGEHPGVGQQRDARHVDRRRVGARPAARRACVQKTPPPVASTSGFSLSSVAVTSLISRGSSMPAWATAVSVPLRRVVCSL